MREKMLTLEQKREAAEARLAKARADRAAVERRLRQEQRRLDNSRKYLLGALLGGWIAADERRLHLAKQFIATQNLRPVDFETLRGTPFEVSPPPPAAGERSEEPAA